jgi:hypothetical protein
MVPDGNESNAMKGRAKIGNKPVLFLLVSAAKSFQIQGRDFVI